MTDIKDDEITGDRIPDLIKIGAIPAQYGQSLRSDIIDATTINQNRVRFTLQRVGGFLHSNSKITLAVTPNTSTTAYYPLHIGVHNLVQKTELFIGNQSICSIDDYSFFAQYQSQFITNETNKEREQFLSQRCINNAPVYDEGTDGRTPNQASKIGLDVGRNPVVDEAQAATGGAFSLLPFMLHDSTSAQTIANAPVYSVYLSDLLPMLKYNQLPCQLIDQEIHIDITFTEQVSALTGASLSRRMCVANSDAGNNAVAYDINTDEVKLIYDSISYEPEIMKKYAEQNQELSFQYVDYRLAKRTGPQTAFSNLTFPVGGNGRLVSKVMFALQRNENFTPVSLLNGVTAKDNAVAQNLAINLLYNDLYEFNTDRNNQALLFHTTQHSEGMVPMVSKDQWQTSGVSSITDSTFEGHAQNSGAAGVGGLFKWISIKPNKGQRVNNKGVDLIYKNAGLPADTYTLRVYLEMLKVMTIKDGKVNCYFA